MKKLMILTLALCLASTALSQVMDRPEVSYEQVQRQHSHHH